MSNSKSLQLSDQEKRSKMSVLSKVFESSKSYIDVILPKNSSLTADRLPAIMLTELKRSQKLLMCDPKDLVSTMLLAARLDLEPGTHLGKFYILPYENRGKGIVETQIIIGYRGLLELMRRSPEITSIYAQPVFKQDNFDYMLGSNPRIEHVKSLTRHAGADDTGDLVAVYAVANLKNGAQEIEIMSKSEVDHVRTYSKASSGPWFTEYAAMARKTVVRRIAKYLPCSVDTHYSIGLEEAVETGREKISQLVEHYTDMQIDYDTGEIIEDLQEEVTQKDDKDSQMTSSLKSKLAR